MNATRPAFREPWLWLVIGIPVATLFGAYLTLRLAYLPGQSDTVPDEVVRTGQAQNVELAPDFEAARRGLIITVDVDVTAGSVRAMQNAGLALPSEPIELRFVHPMHADQDLVVSMRPTAGGWQSQLPRLPKNNWRLLLNDPGIHWRLVGRMPNDNHRAIMRPALPVPMSP